MGLAMASNYNLALTDLLKSWFIRWQRPAYPKQGDLWMIYYGNQVIIDFE